MNSWPKIFLTFSAVLCLLSLGTLGWLALETTAPETAQPATAATQKTWNVQPQAAQQQGEGSKKDGSTQSLPLASDEDDLEESLDSLNQSKAVALRELVLKFTSPEALNAFRARAAQAGIEVLFSDARLGTARVRYRDSARMAAELRQHPGDYDKIAPNYLAWVPGLPRQPQTDASNAGGSIPFESSGLDMIGAQGDRSRWGAGVKVAVLDTGITDHEILTGVKITRQDFIKDGQPLHGHGTAMASLIAGKDPTHGGVAPQSELLDVRVADSKGVGDTATVAQGILWAVDRGARVINISLGASGDSVMLRDAVQYAQSRGVIVVAAAGNEQADQVAYPAGYPGVISVAAVDAQGRQAYFSNSGEVFISAPGVGIISAYSEGKTVIGSGTSQAAAIASGAVSALLSRNYSSTAIPQVLQKNALPTGAPASQLGAGILRLP